ncbi:MAG TPA: alpha-1,2-fucosyltransferase [Candidatus Avimuribaculum pullicola]|nr:alpha-1,2-fucosyltransferase [Candidatus Avimuribaculum pullicola]
MKIVKILGGLGNQMFQYALFVALRQRFSQDEVLVDCSYFKTYRVHTGLELDRVFGVELPQASFSQLLRVTWPVRSFKMSRAIRKLLPPRRTECLEARDYTFNSHVFDAGDMYYDGYWQNFKYFDDYRAGILSLFQFKLAINEKSAAILPELSKPNSVSLHVRRGDYLKAKNYAGLCGVDYYKSAIEYMNAQVPTAAYYVFSDDIEWCRHEIAPMLGDRPITYVDWNKGKDSPLDMMLMSHCSNNVIANSSFSWWAAYLNENKGKIVCAPAKWTNTVVNCRFQLPDWILF